MMDDPKRFFDIAKPGSTPAAPSGRPVIMDTQVAPMPDPMISTAPSQPVPTPAAQPTPAAPVAPAVPDQPLEAVSLQPSPQPTIAGADVDHKLSHDEAFYGHVSKHSKGKKWLIILLALLVTGAAAAGVWYWKKKQADETGKTNATAQTVTPVVEKKPADTIVKSTIGGFELNNKYNWKVTQTDNTKKYAEMSGGEPLGTFDLAISDTQKVSINTNPGGKGGDCVPKAGDVAFKAGNLCPSMQYVSAEPLSETNIPTAQLYTGTARLYVAQYQYMAGAGNDTNYTLVGIIASTKDDKGVETKPELNKPIMGLYVPFTSITLNTAKAGGHKYLEIAITDADGKPTQLSETNLKRVAEVLATLKLL